MPAGMGVAYIKGVQGEGVIPSVKHFDANNEEFERHRIDEQIDARTLHEIYLPAFKAAVRAGRRVDRDVGVQHGERRALRRERALLTGILKKEFGFKGFVISDWGSTYSTAPTVNAGMDLEMPGGPPARTPGRLPRSQASGNSGAWLTADKVLAEVKAGHITEATLDDNVGRILRVIFLSGIFDHPHAGGGEVNTPAQQPWRGRARRKALCC